MLVNCTDRISLEKVSDSVGFGICHIPTTQSHD